MEIRRSALKLVARQTPKIDTTPLIADVDIASKISASYDLQPLTVIAGGLIATRAPFYKRWFYNLKKLF